MRLLNFFVEMRLFDAQSGFQGNGGCWNHLISWLMSGGGGGGGS